MADAIIIHNLIKTFGQNVVLKGINRHFEEGKIHGVIGKNGSGKTVLFKCICGFLQPTSGYVLVKDKIIGKDIDFPEDIGLIIETPGFLPQFSGLKNLEILASLKRKITLDEITNTMQIVGLNPYNKKTVRNYSLGMRQRLGIAQAIMERPTLLILDEPMNGLDKYAISEMYKVLESFASNGCTILISSHYNEDIERLCDTVCIMEDGEMKML